MGEKATQGWFSNAFAELKGNIMIYDKTNKPAFRLAGLLGFGPNSKSVIYYFFKDFSIVKLIICIFAVPLLISALASIALVYTLFYLLRFSIWGIRNSFQSKKKKKVIKTKWIENNHRIFLFNSAIPKEFVEKVDSLEESLVSYLEVLFRIPLHEIEKKVKTVYTIGKIVITVSEIYERKGDYQLIVDIINGVETFESNLKELKEFAKLHKDLILEIIDISKALN